jgi:hypothetical protein
MWRLLRNVALLALLLMGGLKLLLEYAVRQEATRATALLAPYAQLRYEAISAGIDGSIDLSGVSITPAGHTRDVYGAERLTLKTPGPFWILRRWIFTENALPTTLSADVVGPKLPATASIAGLEGWISPFSLVPFETQGCGVASHFSVADYQRMGLNPGKPSEHLDLRYDPDTTALDVRLSLLAPALSSIVLHTEVQHFDPRLAATADGFRKLRVSQFSVEYADQDYLQRRNRFCAQMAGVDPAVFPDQHVAAVRAFLQKHQIDPGTELTKMYRTVVAGGGHVSVMSLPKATFEMGHTSTLSPDELLRELNVTARYNNTPPLMFRLAFAPAADDTDTTAAGVATQTPAAAPIVEATKPTPQNDPPAKAATSDVASAQVAPTIIPPMVTTSKPTTSKPSAPVVADQSSSRIDKHTIREPLFPVFPQKDPPRAKTEAATVAQTPSATSDSSDVLASGPEPPAGSTLALVWKPEIQRLPPPTPAQHDYDVIDYVALSGQIGKSVRLVIESGKQVEGLVQSVDGTSVQLRVSKFRGSGGTALLQIPRATIRQIQLPHRATAG